MTSALEQLPEEILLLILSHLHCSNATDPAVKLKALARVSRVSRLFRRLNELTLYRNLTVVACSALHLKQLLRTLRQRPDLCAAVQAAALGPRFDPDHRDASSLLSLIPRLRALDLSISQEGGLPHVGYIPNLPQPGMDDHPFPYLREVCLRYHLGHKARVLPQYIFWLESLIRHPGVETLRGYGLHWWPFRTPPRQASRIEHVHLVDCDISSVVKIIAYFNKSLRTLTLTWTAPPDFLRQGGELCALANTISKCATGLEKLDFQCGQPFYPYP
ncbi:Uu.00g016380.m01.CDS01, partial [Anthostomella pinea]